MSRKYEVIKVQGHSINIEDDYICLTDMVRANADDARPADVIRNWMRSKSTIDFLGTWEAINNPHFKVFEFEHFKNSAGDNSFSASVSEWVERTSAIGIYSKVGKTGGTYAHKDIAFEFGTAISPVFKLYLIKEYQRLKEAENNKENIDWNIRRVLCKTQYTIQTDAVKNFKIPYLAIPPTKHFIAYAEEGDILNLALFGFTAKQWREANLTLAAKNHNVREFASTNELIVLSNLEARNGEMIEQRLAYSERLAKLKEIAGKQISVLSNKFPQQNFRKNAEGKFLDQVDRSFHIFPSKAIA